jgi:hypothetical protein
MLTKIVLGYSLGNFFYKRLWSPCLRNEIVGLQTIFSVHLQCLDVCNDLIYLL